MDAWTNAGCRLPEVLLNMQISSRFPHAGVAKLVDAQDLKS